MADSDLKSLEREFNRAMAGIVTGTSALKPRLRFPEFEHMLGELGGLGTARLLLAKPKVSSGFADLFLHPTNPESLKLSVEYVVLNPRWRPLFSAAEIETAKKRLIEHQCPLPPDLPQGKPEGVAAPAVANRTLRSPVQISELAAAVNAAAARYEVGRLHELRARIQDAPIHWRMLFDSRTIRPDYAFHVGGRRELQFNIGIDVTAGGAHGIRHGVAFSLETSQTLPTIDPLIPKIERFNEYVRTHVEDFVGFEMWHFERGQRSANRPVAPIEPALVRPGMFIMLGTCIPDADVDVDLILSDFDRIVPLYRYVESDKPVAIATQLGGFVPTKPLGASHTQARIAGGVIEVALRHNELQRALDGCLRESFGANNVASEHRLDIGVRVDAAALTPEGMHFYEIKVAADAQSCIREAIGQLLEYSYLGDDGRAVRLFVVGEGEPNDAARSYLETLRKRLSVPVWYQQIVMAKSPLLPAPV